MDEGRINFFVLVNLLEMALYFILFGVLEFLLFLYVHPSIHPSIHLATCLSSAAAKKGLIYDTTAY
jgi:hypothetical protein